MRHKALNTSRDHDRCTTQFSFFFFFRAFVTLQLLSEKERRPRRYSNQPRVHKLRAGPLRGGGVRAVTGWQLCPLSVSMQQHSSSSARSRGGPSRHGPGSAGAARPLGGASASRTAQGACGDDEGSARDARVWLSQGPAAGGSARDARV